MPLALKDGNAGRSCGVVSYDRSVNVRHRISEIGGHEIGTGFEPDFVVEWLGGNENHRYANTYGIRKRTLDLVKLMRHSNAPLIVAFLVIWTAPVYAQSKQQNVTKLAFHGHFMGEKERPPS